MNCSGKCQKLGKLAQFILSSKKGRQDVPLWGNSFFQLRLSLDVHLSLSQHLLEYRASSNGSLLTWMSNLNPLLAFLTHYIIYFNKLSLSSIVILPWFRLKSPKKMQQFTMKTNSQFLPTLWDIFPSFKTLFISPVYREGRWWSDSEFIIQILVFC